MGLFDTFRQKLPGSPTSVAKIMLKAYVKHTALKPNSTKEEALRFSIESRYQILKVLDRNRIEWIIERSDCLETMVFLTFCCENNFIDEITDDPDPLILQIEKDISDFFQKEAPELSYFGLNR